jgi:hypothetical protein
MLTSKLLVHIDKLANQLVSQLPVFGSHRVATTAMSCLGVLVF